MQVRGVGVEGEWKEHGSWRLIHNHILALCHCLNKPLSLRQMYNLLPLIKLKENLFFLFVAERVVYHVAWFTSLMITVQPLPYPSPATNWISPSVVYKKQNGSLPAKSARSMRQYVGKFWPTWTQSRMPDHQVSKVMALLFPNCPVSPDMTLSSTTHSCSAS